MSQSTPVRWVQAEQSHPLRTFLRCSRDAQILIGCQCQDTDNQVIDEKRSGTRVLSLDLELQPVSPAIHNQRPGDSVQPWSLQEARWLLSDWIQQKPLNDPSLETGYVFLYYQRGDDTDPLLRGFLGHSRLSPTACIQWDIQSLGIYSISGSSWFPWKLGEPLLRQLDLRVPVQAHFHYEYAILNDYGQSHGSRIQLDVDWDDGMDGQNWQHQFPLSGPLTAHAMLSIFLVSSDSSASSSVTGGGPWTTRKELKNLRLLNAIRRGERLPKNWLEPIPELQADFNENGSMAGVKGASRSVAHFLESLEMDVGNGTGLEDDPLSLPIRQDLDFIERVWIFAQRSTCQMDMIQAMNALADHLETGRLVPVLHKHNVTPLSAIVRDCIRLASLSVTDAKERQELKESISSQFDYWLQEPVLSESNEMQETETASGTKEPEEPKVPIVDLLIDLGLAKLKRDFSHWLVGHHLMTWDDFHGLFDSLSSITAQIQVLSALMRVIDLWAVVRANLVCMPAASLQALLRSFLTTWRGYLKNGAMEVDVDMDLAIQYPLPRYASGTSSLLTAVARSFRPNKYQVSLSDRYDENGLIVQLVRHEDLSMTENAGFRGPMAAEETVLDSTYMIDMMPTTLLDDNNYRVYAGSWQRFEW